MVLRRAVLAAFPSPILWLQRNLYLCLVSIAPPQYRAGLDRMVDGRARSSAVEHFLDMEGVTGSIPVAPTTSSDRDAHLNSKTTLEPLGPEPVIWALTAR